MEKFDTMTRRMTKDRAIELLGADEGEVNPADASVKLYKDNILVGILTEGGDLFYSLDHIQRVK